MSPSSKVSKTVMSRSSNGGTVALSKQAKVILENFCLSEVPSHLLRRAHFIAEDIFSKEFAPEAITPRQKAALVVVAKNPGLKQAELADHLHMDRNTIAEMVKRLCASEMLTRTPA